MNNSENTTANTPFANLAALEANFNGIIDRLATMTGKLKDGSPEKAEFEGYGKTATQLRHQVVGVVASRLGTYETKQAAKGAQKSE